TSLGSQQRSFQTRAASHDRRRSVSGGASGPARLTHAFSACHPVARLGPGTDARRRAMTMPRLRRLLMLVLGNVALFAALFALLEVAVRIDRDGLGETWSRLAHGEPVPYSNIGTGKWVIADPELGYRLNPEHHGINALSIRHAEVTMP